MSGKWILESVKNNPTFEKQHTAFTSEQLMRVCEQENMSRIFLYMLPYNWLRKVARLFYKTGKIKTSERYV